MSPYLIGFWILAFLSVVTAVGVVLHRNPIRSALLLVLNFVCLALIYLLLNAQVLAMLQVLVYAGAIMVLFIFVIQVMNLAGELAKSDPLGGQQKWMGLILGLLLLGALGWGVNFLASNPNLMVPTAAATARNTELTRQGVSQIQVIGWELFTRYVYPFELTSILLLVGAIGVIILTKRHLQAPSSNATTHS